MKITTSLVGKVLLLLLLAYFSFQLLTTPQPWILIDNLNLFIHEAGHLIFTPFGEFIAILGGSLFQILFPGIFLTYFLLRKELLGVAFSLFWVANNIINVSVYMKDAIPMRLPLLGGDGVIHDWNWIFTTLNILDKSELIGSFFYYIGAAGLLTSLILIIFLTLLEALAS